MGHSEYSVYVGTDTGILKAISFDEEGIKLKKNTLPDKNKKNLANGITCMQWRNQQESEVYTGHRNGVVRLYDTSRGEYVYSSKCSFGSGKVIGLAPLETNVLVGLSSGEVDYLMRSKDQAQKSPLIQTLPPKYKGPFAKWKQSLEVLRPHPLLEGVFATGGCHNDLKIFDINRPKLRIFSARNVANDELDLPVPVWITDLAYLPDHKSIVTVSWHSHVRVYDPRSGRKPVSSRTLNDWELTSVAALPNSPGTVIVGASHGRMALFDLRGQKNRNLAEHQRKCQTDQHLTPPP